MKESKADIILHPVRMRIIQVLIGGKRLTVQQMLEYLTDIPQASLYRHLKKLVEADLVVVVGENQVRGTIEKVYSLPNQQVNRINKDIQDLSREEHIDLFMKFIANVLADFDRYLSNENFDLLKDGVGYRQARFYASDEEFKELAMTVAGAMGKLMNNNPSPERKTRIVTTIACLWH
ncbi:MAG: helix-turn-helix domain-containing protein, partial [Heyndrickxia sp.]